ncbi:site-specific integrase [Thalassomonas sp. M1454]|uniref:site-specific integrase n=1 Tax=Thalassomonas sp. M1454 TaxID=2594477 RepID=UPI001180A5AC|nr:site-specific integrase [Thalassomonas sp. M1454]TRX57969.1 site-specific integrase [Thalassomonas sp. M1454]
MNEINENITLPYAVKDLSCAFSLTFNGDTTPTNLPKFNILISRLKDISERLPDASVFIPLLREMDSFEHEKLQLHSFEENHTHADYPIYYLFQEIDEDIWDSGNDFISIICCSILHGGQLPIFNNKANKIRLLLGNADLVNNVTARLNLKAIKRKTDFKSKAQLLLEQLEKFLYTDTNTASNKTYFGYIEAAFYAVKDMVKAFWPVGENELKVSSTRSNLSLAIENSFKYKALNIGDNSRDPLQNNFPQQSRWVLMNEEAIAIYGQLNSIHKTSDNNSDKKACFSLMLCLELGLDPTWLDRVSVTQNFDTSEISSLSANQILVMASGSYFFRVPVLGEKRIDQVANGRFIKKGHQTHLEFSCSAGIRELLDTYQDQEFGTSENLACIKKVIEKLRGRLGNRIDLRLIREFRFNAFYRQCKDELVATLMTPISNYRPPTGIYYTHIELSKIYHVYTCAMELVHGIHFVEQPMKPGYIGSRFAIDEDKLVDWVKCKNKKISELKVKDRSIHSLIEYHNEYTLYVATIAMLLTGHRAVNDVFNERNFFFLEEELLAISDKKTDTNNLRFVPVVSLLKCQIENYQSHLANLVERIYPHNATLAGNINYTAKPQKAHYKPFFFVIENENLEGISRSVLQNFWGPEFDLPANFNRYFLSSYLTKQKVPREYINNLLGHLEKGQDPLNINNPINIQILLKPVKNGLEYFASDILKITAVKGLRGINSDVLKLNHHFEISTNKFGSSDREKRVDKEKRKAKKLVDTYLNEHIPRLLSKSNAVLISDIEKQSMEQCAEQAPNRIQGKVKSLIQQRIDEYYKYFNLKPLVLWRNVGDELKYIKSFKELASAQQFLIVHKSVDARLFDLIDVNNDKKFKEIVVLNYFSALLRNLPKYVSLAQFIEMISVPAEIRNGQYYFPITHGKSQYNWFPSTNILAFIKTFRKKLSTSKITISTPVIEKVKNEISAITNTRITVDKVKKLGKYSALFYSSPSEWNQRIGNVLFPRQNIPANSKPFKEKRNFKISSNSEEFLSFIHEINDIRNNYNAMRASEYRIELQKVLTKHELSCCPLTNFYTQWGQLMIDTGTVKAGSPAVSTICQYLAEPSLLALDYSQLLNIFVGDEYDQAETFEEILDGENSTENSHPVLMNLQRFLVLGLGKSPIPFSSNFHKEIHVNTNVFSEEEIKKLVTNNIFEDKEKLFISLLIDTGARVSEIYYLINRDVSEKFSHIIFRNNALKRLKNRHSRRVFSFNELSDETLSLLYEIKSIVDPKTGKKLAKQAAIFDREGLSLNQPTYNQFKNTLNLKIQEIIGRPITLRSIRHYFASQKFNNNNYTSYREVWQYSAIQGHASPDSTQLYYIQDAFAENPIIPITSIQLSQFTGLSVDNIRQIRSRKYRGIEKEISNALILKNK